MTAGTRRRLLLAVCAAPFLNLVNLSSVNLALPDIAADPAFSEATLQWVVSVYALAFAGVVLLGGRLADLYGGRRIMSVGFAMFGVCALLAAVAPSSWLLVVARGLQGVGAAMMVPAGLEVIGATFRGDRERARAVAMFIVIQARTARPLMPLRVWRAAGFAAVIVDRTGTIG
ncbi:MAG: MFS transporter [Pseudonocardia sp.]